MRAGNGRANQHRRSFRGIEKEFSSNGSISAQPVAAHFLEPVPTYPKALLKCQNPKEVLSLAETRAHANALARAKIVSGGRATALPPICPAARRAADGPCPATMNSDFRSRPPVASW